MPLLARALVVLCALAPACKQTAPTIGSDPTPPTKDAAAPTKPPPPELPSGWVATEMDLDPPDSPRRVSLVLAYRSLVDDRPLYLDEAIVWTHRDADAGEAESWRLTHVYRHPKDDGKWHLSIVYDAEGYESSAPFSHAPTIDEAKKFFVDTWWWERDADFRTLAAGMPRSSWSAAFHADPIAPPPKDPKAP